MDTPLPPKLEAKQTDESSNIDTGTITRTPSTTPTHNNTQTHQSTSLGNNNTHPILKTIRDPQQLLPSLDLPFFDQFEASGVESIPVSDFVFSLPPHSEIIRPEPNYDDMADQDHMNAFEGIYHSFASQLIKIHQILPFLNSKSTQLVTNNPNDLLISFIKPPQLTDVYPVLYNHNILDKIAEKYESEPDFMLQCLIPLVTCTDHAFRNLYIISKQWYDNGAVQIISKPLLRPYLLLQTVLIHIHILLKKYPQLTLGSAAMYNFAAFQLLGPVCPEACYSIPDFTPDKPRNDTAKRVFFEILDEIMAQILEEGKNGTFYRWENDYFGQTKRNDVSNEVQHGPYFTPTADLTTDLKDYCGEHHGFNSDEQGGLENPQCSPPKIPIFLNFNNINTKKVSDHPLPRISQQLISISRQFQLVPLPIHRKILICLELLLDMSLYMLTLYPFFISSAPTDGHEITLIASLISPLLDMKYLSSQTAIAISGVISGLTENALDQHFHGIPSVRPRLITILLNTEQNYTLLNKLMGQFFQNISLPLTYSAMTCGEQQGGLTGQSICQHILTTMACLVGNNAFRFLNEQNLLFFQNCFFYLLVLSLFNQWSVGRALLDYRYKPTELLQFTSDEIAMKGFKQMFHNNQSSGSSPSQFDNIDHVNNFNSTTPQFVSFSPDLAISTPEYHYSYPPSPQTPEILHPIEWTPTNPSFSAMTVTPTSNFDIEFSYNFSHFKSFLFNPMFARSKPSLTPQTFSSFQSWEDNEYQQNIDEFQFDFDENHGDKFYEKNSINQFDPNYEQNKIGKICSNLFNTMTNLHHFFPPSYLSKFFAKYPNLFQSLCHLWLGSIHHARVDRIGRYYGLIKQNFDSEPLERHQDLPLTYNYTEFVELFDFFVKNNIPSHLPFYLIDIGYEMVLQSRYFVREQNNYNHSIAPGVIVGDYNRFYFETAQGSELNNERKASPRILPVNIATQDPNLATLSDDFLGSINVYFQSHKNYMKVQKSKLDEQHVFFECLQEKKLTKDINKAICEEFSQLFPSFQIQFQQQLPICSHFSLFNSNFFHIAHHYLTSQYGSRRLRYRQIYCAQTHIHNLTNYLIKNGFSGDLYVDPSLEQFLEPRAKSGRFPLPSKQHFDFFIQEGILDDFLNTSFNMLTTDDEFLIERSSHTTSHIADPRLFLLHDDILTEVFAIFKQFLFSLNEPEFFTNFVAKFQPKHTNTPLANNGDNFSIFQPSNSQNSTKNVLPSSNQLSNPPVHVYELFSGLGLGPNLKFMSSKVLLLLHALTHKNFGNMIFKMITSLPWGSHRLAQSESETFFVDVLNLLHCFIFQPVLLCADFEPFWVEKDMKKSEEKRSPGGKKEPIGGNTPKQPPTKASKSRPLSKGAKKSTKATPKKTFEGYSVSINHPYYQNAALLQYRHETSGMDRQNNEAEHDHGNNQNTDQNNDNIEEDYESNEDDYKDNDHPFQSNLICTSLKTAVIRFNVDSSFKQKPAVELGNDVENVENVQKHDEKNQDENNDANFYLHKHPSILQRPLVGLYVDTLVYIMQGFSYTMFETAASNSTSAKLQQTLSISSNSLKNDFVQKSTICKSVKKISHLKRIEEQNIEAENAKNPKRIKSKTPQKTTPNPKLRDEYDINMRRTQCSDLILRASSLPLDIYSQYHHHYSSQGATTIAPHETLPPPPTLQTIPISTEFSSAMVQFCIESFIDLLLDNNIFKMLDKFEFKREQKSVGNVTLSNLSPTNLHAPTLSHLTDVDITDNGLGVISGYVYRDELRGELRKQGNGALLFDGNGIDDMKKVKKIDPRGAEIENHQDRTQFSTFEHSHVKKSSVLVPHTPQHFGFFDALPQDELFAFYKALQLNNILYLDQNENEPNNSRRNAQRFSPFGPVFGDNKSTTNFGKICHIIPKNVDNIDFFPVFGGNRINIDQVQWLEIENENQNRYPNQNQDGKQEQNENNQNNAKVDHFSNFKTKFLDINPAQIITQLNNISYDILVQDVGDFDVELIQTTPSKYNFPLSRGNNIAIGNNIEEYSPNINPENDQNDENDNNSPKNFDQTSTTNILQPYSLSVLHSLRNFPSHNRLYVNDDGDDGSYNRDSFNQIDFNNIGPNHDHNHDLLHDSFNTPTAPFNILYRNSHKIGADGISPPLKIPLKKAPKSYSHDAPFVAKIPEVQNEDHMSSSSLSLPDPLDLMKQFMYTSQWYGCSVVGYDAVGGESVQISEENGKTREPVIRASVQPRKDPYQKYIPDQLKLVAQPTLNNFQRPRGFLE